MPKEYIERGALINATKKAIERNNSAKYAMIDNDFLDLIADAPTEDVVEVVRCGNCKHKSEWIRNGLGEYFCRRSGLWCLTDNHFCSYGERRDKDR